MKQSQVTERSKLLKVPGFVNDLVEVRSDGGRLRVINLAT